MKLLIPILISMFAALSCSGQRAPNSIPKTIGVSAFSRNGTDKTYHIDSSEKIKVMVIDTGIEPHTKIKPFLASGWESNSEDYPIPEKDDISGQHHGTHVAGIVLFGDQNKSFDPVCDLVTIYSCKFFNANEKGNLYNTVSCLNKAAELNVNFVNYSAGGNESSEQEKEALQKLLDKGVKVIVAAGNGDEGKEVKQSFDYYPAGYINDTYYDNLIPVANLTYDGNRAKTSNFQGGIVFDYGTNIKSTISLTQYGYMTGTSQAAAMYTHRLIMKRCMQIQYETRKVKTLKLEK